MELNINQFGLNYCMKNHKSKSAIIIGSGLGGLSTALRLSHLGYEVTVIEKHSKPGGRLNQLKN